MLVSVRSVFLILLVASAFIFVCMMAWLTRNSPYWINKKLYLGGLLVLLIAVINGCQCATQPANETKDNPTDNMVTCYAPPPPPIAVDKVTIPTLHDEQKSQITDLLEAMKFSVVHYKGKTIYARKGNLHITINSINGTTSIELSTFERAPSEMNDNEWKDKIREENKNILDEIVGLVEKSE